MSECVLPGFTGLESELLFDSCSLPCLVGGAMIMTKTGLVRVEDLCPNDRVLTRDSGFQPVGWVGARRFNPAIERPICLPTGFCSDFPTDRNLLLSPTHRVLRFDGARSVSRRCEESLVEAKNIAMAAPVGSVSIHSNFYVHVLFERHQIICADGVWVESLRPTADMIAGLSDSNRSSMIAQLPKVATLDREDYCPARLLAA